MKPETATHTDEDIINDFIRFPATQKAYRDFGQFAPDAPANNVGGNAWLILKPPILTGSMRYATICMAGK